MADLLTTITELPVANIETGTRLRPVSEAGVEALMASIGELGVMKDAIHVLKVKHKGGKLILMAGAHRLEAAKRLGWEVIAAKVWHCTDDWAELMEIDDNLASAELTALDTAVFLASRKKVYERLHPESRKDAFHGNRHTGKLATDIVSFASATAEKFGLSDRHVYRLLQAGEVLEQDKIALLRRAPRPVTLKDLSEIAKTQSEAERLDVCSMLARGTVKSAAEARRLFYSDGTVKQKDPVEEAFKALSEAWSRAPETARRRFIDKHHAALSERVQDETARRVSAAHDVAKAELADE